jgi:hypothetical protein
MSDQDGFLPKSKPATSNNFINTLLFMMKQTISPMNVATLAEVVAVDVASRTGPVGTVDIRVLVQEVDGAGKPQASDIIYEVPFFRLQGGANAVIVDPVVGDIGFVVFADKDLSAVQASGAANPPGSKRRFNMADALYIGGWCKNVEPTSYIIVDGESIDIVSPTAVNATAPTFTINGALHVTGPITTDDAITADGEVTGNGIVLSTHKHGGVVAGGAQTGVPV